MRMPPKDPGYRTTTKHDRYLRELKEWRRGVESNKDTVVNNEVTKLIEQQQPQERTLVGDRGHWISPTGVVNDGREQWGIFDPKGARHANVWTKEKAEAAVYELIEKGNIAR